MNEDIQHFRQSEYNRVLAKYNAREKSLSHSECVNILIGAGASYEQAKNGAYVYLHQKNHLNVRHNMTQEKYDKILDNFNACNMEPKECIKHLEKMDYSYGQAKTAVYRYRVKRNLIGKRTLSE